MTHILVPEHRVLGEEEKREILKKYDIKLHQFPKIFKNDSAIREMNPKVGDLVEIVRDSPTAGKAIYYRVVVVE
jgi:DNA-directed RNA polymerase subunit H